MALTIVKYQKSAEPAVILNSRAQMVQQVIKKPAIRLDNHSNIILNNIPAVIKPSMKRIGVNAEEILTKTPKYTLHNVISNQTQWQQTTGSKQHQQQQQQIGAAINSLPPNTIIKSTQRTYGLSSSSNMSTTTPTTPQAASTTASRPATVFIKRDAPKRSLRSMTLDMIDQNPLLHVGIPTDRLAILKRTINSTTNVTHMDCCLTLKKLRQNESFGVLAEYFELSQTEAELIFTQTLARLARYLRYLICWPASKQYNERRKYMPFGYRESLFHVQSLIECVETDIDSKLNFDYSSYKFIYCINTNNIISFISEAYDGDCDDLMLFDACNFKAHIPKYLTLVAEPGKAIRRQRANGTKPTDSIDDTQSIVEQVVVEDKPALSKYDAQRITGELSSTQTLSVTDGKLTSSRVKNLNLPTVRVCNTICRDQIREMIDKLREFKILQPCAIQEPMIFEYINEILIVAAALTNLAH